MIEFYNSLHDKLINIEEGEELCSKCNGKGVVPIHNAYGIKKHRPRNIVCDKCLGDGKIDWAEKAVGRKG